VSLALYAENLDPEAVTVLLGCTPTHAHRKGDRKKPSSPPFKTGAWFLTMEGKAPIGPGDLIIELLQRFPHDKTFWMALRKNYEVQIRVGIHTGGWNRGFDLTAPVTELIARTGAALGFDLYFYGDDVEI
jgi:hypothetical protein